MDGQVQLASLVLKEGKGTQEQQVLPEEQAAQVQLVRILRAPVCMCMLRAFECMCSANGV